MNSHLFNFYIYDRKGKCLYYREWQRPLNTLADDPQEERKLMFGMVFSLKDLAAQMSGSSGGEGLHTFKTNSYTLHHFVSVTGVTFIMNTDLTIGGIFIINTIQRT
jgi:hypothetical protein